MTVRIETAEKALRELQRRKDPPAAPEGPGTAAKQEDTASASSPGDPAGEKHEDEKQEEEEEEETDEEREKRQKEEEAEQRKLIGYDEVTKSFRRWRPDFKCGSKVPLLPDGEVVECEAKSDLPCCSSMGWCGKSADHCSCELCANYQESMQVIFKSFKLVAAKRECEKEAYNLGEQKSPMDCAPLLVQRQECGRSFMISSNYPAWGCRCCSGGTGADEEEKPEWSVYSIDVEVREKTRP